MMLSDHLIETISNTSAGIVHYSKEPFDYKFTTIQQALEALVPLRELVDELDFPMAARKDLPADRARKIIAGEIAFHNCNTDHQADDLVKQVFKWADISGDEVALYTNGNECKCLQSDVHGEVA
jgi:hypothetical protein